MAKELTLTSKILIFLEEMGDMLSPWMNPYEFRNRALFGNLKSYKSTLYKLQRRGLIQLVDKNAEKFIKLTRKGELEILLAKAFIPRKQQWDGKWRIFIFDIPEETKEKRHLLRSLLKKSGFKKLQGSVYASPYPVNREAVSYLEQTGLHNYIRIMKVEEMDNDKDLRKKFNLRETKFNGR